MVSYQTLYPIHDDDRVELQRLFAMAQTEVYTDVYLKLDDGTQLPCHRIVLAAASDYFHEALTARSADLSTIPLSGITRRVGQILWEAIYFSEGSFSASLFFEVYVAANRFRLVSLQRRLLNSIIEDGLLGNPDFFVDFAIFVYERPAIGRSLETICPGFVQRMDDLNAVMIPTMTSHLLEVDYEFFSRYLVFKEFGNKLVDETQLILQWVNYDVAERLVHLDGLLALYFHRYYSDAQLNRMDLDASVIRPTQILRDRLFKASWLKTVFDNGQGCIVCYDPVSGVTRRLHYPDPGPDAQLVDVPVLADMGYGSGLRCYVMVKQECGEVVVTQCSLRPDTMSWLRSSPIPTIHPLLGRCRAEIVPVPLFSPESFQDSFCAYVGEEEVLPGLRYSVLQFHLSGGSSGEHSADRWPEPGSKICAVEVGDKSVVLITGKPLKDVQNCYIGEYVVSLRSFPVICKAPFTAVRICISEQENPPRFLVAPSKPYDSFFKPGPPSVFAVVGIPEYPQDWVELPTPKFSGLRLTFLYYDCQLETPVLVLLGENPTSKPPESFAHLFKFNWDEGIVLRLGRRQLEELRPSRENFWDGVFRRHKRKSSFQKDPANVEDDPATFWTPITVSQPTKEFLTSSGFDLDKARILSTWINHERLPFLGDQGEKYALSRVKDCSNRNSLDTFYSLE